MCWKKKPPIEYPQANKIFLTYAINDYAGSDNDLNECISDQDYFIAKLGDFQIRRFTDSQVTRAAISGIKSVVDTAKSGDLIVVHYSGHGTQVRDYRGLEPDGYHEALYVYDGAYLDDDFLGLFADIPEGVKVLVLIDSCFSGGMARNPHKVRFHQTEDRIYTKRIKSVIRGELSCIIIGACQEDQVAMDGAFSPCAASVIIRTFTYQQWYEKIKLCLEYNNFAQVPTIDGKSELIERKLFE